MGQSVIKRSELSALSEVKSATLYSNSNVNSGECKYVTIGKICVVSGNIEFKAAATNAVVFSGLPVALLNNSPLSAITGGDDSGGHYCYVLGDKISMKASRAGTFRISGAYIVK